MNTEMSNEICSSSIVSEQQSDDDSTTDKQIYSRKQRKKLSLTNELLGDIMQFKHLMKKHNEINLLDSIKCENPRSDRDEACGGAAMDVREKTYRSECLVKLTNYLDGLRRLDRSKGEHLENLERFLSEEERVIETLRTDMETAHAAYEIRKQTFFESFRDAEFVQSVLFGAVRKLKAVCAEQDLWIASRDNAVGTVVDALRDELDALVADMERVQESSTADVVEIAVRRRLDVDRPGQSAVPRDRSRARFDDFPGLLHAIECMREKNRILETTAEALDGEVASLHASLSDVTAEYNALDADKTDQKCKAVVLDDFCEVTEQINALQIRNLEFGRTLVVDDKHITKELSKIEQLKTKISKKNEKKEKIAKETDYIKNQLDMYMNKYEDLERRNAFLTNDLMNVKLRSPSNFTDPSEIQGIGSRTKHLHQLKIHYSKMANKRNALKLKLQKEQQVAKSFER